MNILVTGSHGFIGSHLCERLTALGHVVTSYDMRAFASDDITDRAELCWQCTEHAIEAVVHLAALPGVRYSVTHAPEVIRTNVVGTLNVLEACRLANIPRIIFASSSSVYGDNPTPWHEAMPFGTPLSPYAASKQAGEQLCRTYAHLYGFRIAMLRFFTVYGPRQRADLAIATFARQMLAGEPLTVYGDGTSARDYTYIDDAVEGICRAISWTSNAIAGECEAFNIAGRGLPASLKEIIWHLEQALEHEALVQHVAPQRSDPPLTLADLTKSRDMLGYAAQTTFQEGIQRYCDWLRTRTVNK